MEVAWDHLNVAKGARNDLYNLVSPKCIFSKNMQLLIAPIFFLEVLGCKHLFYKFLWNVFKSFFDKNYQFFIYIVYKSRLIPYDKRTGMGHGLCCNETKKTCLNL